MPIIGHAFVGIVTAHEFEPGGRRNPHPLRNLAQALWMPTIVGLAYFPDVVTQLGLWAGYGSAKLAGHSALIGLAAGVIAGILWARLTGASPRLTCALAVGSILAHDALDLLQATDRMPLWPLLRTPVGADWLFFPSRLSGELLWVGLPCAVYEGRRALRVRRSAAMLSPSAVWAGRALVLLMLASAVGVQLARREQRRQIDVADALLRTGRFAAALTVIDAADHWPWSTGPGRFDMLRGEAHGGLGDAVRAEMYLLKAYRSDPDGFRILADLADFYASHDTAAQRLRRSAPYVDELRRRHSRHRSFPALMVRVERAIATGS